jgi:hypothetical protein
MKFFILLSLLFTLFVSIEALPHRMHKMTVKLAKMKLKHKLKQIFS